VIDAATGLAAYDLKTARGAVFALPGPVPAADLMRLGARAVKREPEAAGRLMMKVIDGAPSQGGMVEDNDEITLAEVATAPDLRRALAVAQQHPSPELQAAALLTVAQRLEQRGKSPSATGPRPRER
jgi:hypothetical protein